MKTSTILSFVFILLVSISSCKKNELASKTSLDQAVDNCIPDFSGGLKKNVLKVPLDIDLSKNCETLQPIAIKPYTMKNCDSKTYGDLVTVSIDPKNPVKVQGEDKSTYNVSTFNFYSERPIWYVHSITSSKTDSKGKVKIEIDLGLEKKSPQTVDIPNKATSFNATVYIIDKNKKKTKLVTAGKLCGGNIIRSK